MFYLNTKDQVRGAEKKTVFMDQLIWNKNLRIAILVSSKLFKSQLKQTQKLFSLSKSPKSFETLWNI